MSARVYSRMTVRHCAVCARLPIVALSAAVALVALFLAPVNGMAQTQPRFSPEQLEAWKKESRVALVIGNGAYKSGGLPNAVRDAELIAKVLDDAGFTVVLKTDANRRAMVEAVDDFRQQMHTERGVRLFYYSGHGVQVEGRNYLVPIGARLEVARDVEFEAVSVDRIMAAMEVEVGRVNLLFLDACRNNPFPVASRSASRGLALVDAPSGTLVGYATAPGKTAADGDGSNSPYTEALARHIAGPALPISELMMNVRRDVKAKVKQEPWENTSLTEHFYFRVPDPCLPGQSLADGKCVGEVSCPEGTTLANGKCLATATCPEGTYRHGNHCVVTRTSCPAGSRVMGGQCVADATCPPGTVREGDRCIRKTSCPDGHHEEAGGCVSDAARVVSDAPLRPGLDGRSRALRIAGWATTAVGAALLVSGGAVHGSFASSCAEGGICPSDSESRWRTAKVLYGVGGALGATGAVFVISGSLSGHGERSKTRGVSRFGVLAGPWSGSEEGPR